MSELIEKNIATTVGGDESLLVSQSEESIVTFDDLGLSKEVLRAVHDLGFESPTPIQERSIPVVLSGKDMIGQAQTGTGKTAAFSLPILSRIDCKKSCIQALILEPTRELAIQSAEACQSFSKYIKDFRVAPIYGGASYENQIRTLRHGAQVVVATPGRLIDLIERGKVDLSNLSFMVIDEADEMLRMGFIDDVDWILSNTPDSRQTVLFSATMPPVIAKIAKNHLTEPVDVRIESKTTTATTVHQRYWIASGAHKIDAMTRILEVENYDAVIVFVRTKTDAEDVSNKLMARGLACAALHGDIPQRQREKIIDRLKAGHLDIIIATDVAARGLDVDRITHVFNYDIPYDAESYVHRIGRTGRAGRTGEAILFVSPRERRALRLIERVTGQKIEPMQMPSVADVNKARLENFKNQVMETIAEGNLEMYEEVISELLSDDSIEVETLCAALAKMVQKDGTLLLDDSKPEPRMRTFDDDNYSERGQRRGLPSAEAAPLREYPDMAMVRFRVAVGRKDGVKPGQIVGAIANEGNIESKFIGEISIFDTFTTVDLPDGMPKDTMHILAQARVCGRPLDLRLYTAEPPRSRGNRERNRKNDRYGDDKFDRQGRHSGKDFRKFEGGSRGSRSDRRERLDFGSDRGRLKRGDKGSKSGFRSSFSGRREGF
ncbi:MAG: DEAD/DEAH box helicase [Succinivibrio sp.]|nr:DEAD/DEAH box helicase [Succinivibrio sp.]